VHSARVGDAWRRLPSSHGRLRTGQDASGRAEHRRTASPGSRRLLRWSGISPGFAVGCSSAGVILRMVQTARSVRWDKEAIDRWRGRLPLPCRRHSSQPEHGALYGFYHNTGKSRSPALSMCLVASKRIHCAPTQEQDPAPEEWARMDLPALLGLPPRLAIESLCRTSTALTVSLVSTTAAVCCPQCGANAKRIHSRYQRTMADLPCGDDQVVLRLWVRRFFCPNAACARRLFAERLSEVVEPYARRTTRLLRALRAIGFTVGGEAGARLTRHLHLPTSASTLLRVLPQYELK